MYIRAIILAAIVTVASSCYLRAQTAPPSAAPQEKPTVKHVPATYTNPSSGKEMYKAYCASCHGPNGAGDGPAGPALKMPPTNLTMLLVKNGGSFPTAHVEAEIRGDAMVPAHGSKDMPVWGRVFMSVSGHSPAQTQLRIRNLTGYLESIQVH